MTLKKIILKSLRKAFTAFKLAIGYARKIIYVLWANFLHLFRTIKHLIHKMKIFFLILPEHLTFFFIKKILPTLIDLNIYIFKLRIEKKGVGQIGFIPYQSPDCITQHALIATILEKYGYKTTIIKPSIPFSNSIKDPFIADSFDDLISHIVKMLGNDYIFSRGVIDEFVRLCDLSVFQGKHQISSEFLNLTADVNEYAAALVAPYKAIVLADSAYSLNRAMRSNAHKNLQPIFALNPHGQWQQITPLSDENFSLIRFDQILLDLSEGKESEYLEATSYLEKRFSGKSKSDLDSSKTFSKNKLVNNYKSFKEPKKVLFLHSFRDASGLNFPDNTNELFFPTYFQWADAAFRLISKQQENWIIKPHPSQGHYPNDNEILDFLLTKHGIDKGIVNSEFSTPYALENKWLIYTCSGTIAQEAACFGFKAHTVSGRIPDQISKRAKTISEFEYDFNKPVDTSSELIEDEKILKAAKIFFAEQHSGSRLYAKKISPNNPVLPSLSAVDIYKQKCRALMQMTLICSSPKKFKIAHQIAQDIITTIESAAY